MGYSGNLLSASKAESIATGTVILNSSISNFANPTYSISGGDNKFAIDSSTGQVTLANALDFETDQSHSFTVTANRRWRDGNSKLYLERHGCKRWLYWVLWYQPVKQKVLQLERFNFEFFS